MTNKNSNIKKAFLNFLKKEGLEGINKLLTEIQQKKTSHTSYDNKIYNILCNDTAHYILSKQNFYQVKDKHFENYEMSGQYGSLLGSISNENIFNASSNINEVQMEYPPPKDAWHPSEEKYLEPTSDSLELAA